MHRLAVPRRRGHARGRRLLTVDDRRIAADVLVRSDGRRLASLVSQADEPVTAEPHLAAGLRLARPDAAAADGSVTLTPFGVGVFRLDDVT